MAETSLMLAQRGSGLCFDKADNGLFDRRIITNDLIFHIIFDFCSPATLIRFSRVSRATHAAVQSYYKRAFNPNRLFSRFFPDPVAFRSLQAKTQALVSGSTALQFFDRSFYPESDLDLYLPYEHKKTVGCWLLDLGYTFEPNSAQREDFLDAVEQLKGRIEDFADDCEYSDMQGVAAVYTFTKDDYWTGETLRVQCIVAENAPIEVILRFHSTVVMNVIAFDRAYCMYPKATLETREALITRPHGFQVEKAIQKYSDRGWKMVRRFPITQYNIAVSAFGCGARYIEDEHSWSIPLNMEVGITFPQSINQSSLPLTRDPVACTTWTLTFKFTKPLCSPDISFLPLQANQLYHFYVFSDHGVLAGIRQLVSGAHAARASKTGPPKCFDQEMVIGFPELWKISRENERNTALTADF